MINNMILPIHIIVLNFVLVSSLILVMIHLYRNRKIAENRRKQLLVMILGWLIIMSIGVLFAYTVILNNQIAD
jgi:hypothetical protein